MSVPSKRLAVRLLKGAPSLSAQRLLLASSLALMSAACSPVQGAGPDRAARRAIALGIDENQVNLIGDTLAERGAFDVRRVLLAEGAELDSQVKPWANEIKAEARQAILYFRGGLTVGDDIAFRLHRIPSGSQAPGVALADL